MKIVSFLQFNLDLFHSLQWSEKKEFWDQIHKILPKGNGVEIMHSCHNIWLEDARAWCKLLQFFNLVGSTVCFTGGRWRIWIRCMRAEEGGFMNLIQFSLPREEIRNTSKEKSDVVEATNIDREIYGTFKSQTCGTVWSSSINVFRI